MALMDDIRGYRDYRRERQKIRRILSEDNQNFW